MAAIRPWVERLLRATGTFHATKRMLLATETAGLHTLTSCRRMLNGNAWPHCRLGNLVMFHTGRSGSSVVADLLGRHPAVHWDGELFNYHLNVWRSRPKDRMADAQRMIKRRIYFFNVPYYGFEVLTSQLVAGNIEKKRFIDALDTLGIDHYILLTRRNILRKIVSNLVARERGRWHLGSEEIARLTQIHVDVVRLRLATTRPLIVHLRDTQSEYDALQALLSSRRCLRLVYEDDILKDPRDAVRKFCDFLDVDYLELPVRHGRTTPQPLHQIIDNYVEVEDVLSGTEFEWMLTEV
jgi:hypothetical protein